MRQRWAKAMSVTVVPPYTLAVRFADGTSRAIALESDLWGEVFESLRDPELFARAELEPHRGSVVWPTGADLAPKFLYYGDENLYGDLLDAPAEPDRLVSATSRQD